MLLIYPQCKPHHKTACHTIMYAPADVAWVNQLMMRVYLHVSFSPVSIFPFPSPFIRNFGHSIHQVAENNGLEYRTTFMEVANNVSFDLDNSTIFDYILQHPNSTQHALIFLSGISRSLPLCTSFS